LVKGVIRQTKLAYSAADDPQKETGNAGGYWAWGKGALRKKPRKTKVLVERGQVVGEINAKNPRGGGEGGGVGWGS